MLILSMKAFFFKKITKKRSKNMKSIIRAVKTEDKELII